MPELNSLVWASLVVLGVILAKTHVYLTLNQTITVQGNLNKKLN